MKIMTRMFVFLLIISVSFAINNINLDSKNEFNYQLDNPYQIIGDITIGNIEYSHKLKTGMYS